MFCGKLTGNWRKSPLTTPEKVDRIQNIYAKCAEKDEYPPPRRKESRRLVKGGREGAGKITLELRAERQ